MNQEDFESFHSLPSGHMDRTTIEEIRASIHREDGISDIEPVEMPLAWDEAHAELPAINKALGYLATANTRHIQFHREHDGPNFMPALAPLKAVQRERVLSKAKAAVREAEAAALLVETSYLINTSA